MELKNAISWRYATKRMTGRKISENDFSEILEAIRLAPTSRGLQPFKVFVIESSDIKRKIQSVADEQPQVVECSHLLLFAAETGISLDALENYVKHLATERNIPLSKVEGLKNVIARDQLTMNKEQYYHWASKQAYIALSYGQLMAVTKGIDAAAMEGFNPKLMDELLDLQSKGLRSTVLLALGYRDEENDYMLKLKKVRKSANELFININTI